MKTVNYNTQIFGSNDRQVFAIIVYCLSLAFAVLVASLETVRSTQTGFFFEVSWRTVLIFVLAGVILVPCFKTIFQSRQKHRRSALLIFVCAIGLGAFAYPLRFVPAEKYGDILLGLTVAACALSIIGTILFLINRFLNADARSVEVGTASKAS